jgi:hypothetical protein
MSEHELPAECHPDLKWVRLLELAQFFAKTRSDVVALHNPLGGDDSWSLGCRGFARCRNLLLAKAKSGDWEWFSILNPSKKFMFAIGAVPVRFYRGRHNFAPSRTLASSHEELAQLSFAFATEGAAAFRDLKWRFAIETDFLGGPSAVIFVGLVGHSGAVAYHWRIPFDIPQMEIELPETEESDMVELGAPIVGTHEDSRRHEGDGDA